MNKSDKIKEFWDSQAELFGGSYEATIPDKYLKKLEIENVNNFLIDGLRVLDVGCGNGYSTFRYANSHDIAITGLDYSEKMIATAKTTLEQKYHNLKNKISFATGDITNIPFEKEFFDIVMSNRCMINLSSRADQGKAIQEMHRTLKMNGLMILCEDTEQGLRKLNDIRKLVGLEEIKTRWHNLYIDEVFLFEATKDMFQLERVLNFSSFYYLASRVINGKISQQDGLEPSYDSDINKIAALCSSHIEGGDYSPLKLFVMRKKE